MRPIDLVPGFVRRRPWRSTAIVAAALIALGWYASLGCAGTRLDRMPGTRGYCTTGEGNVYLGILVAGLAIAVVALAVAAVVPIRSRMLRRRPS